MIRNYFLITFRGMLRNKVFIAINVFGMGVAIACAIVAFLANDYDESFDRSHVNGEHIYRISSVRRLDNELKKFGHTSLPLGDIARKSIADIEQASRYVDSWSSFKRGTELFPTTVSYVDPVFFKMFTFAFVAGGGTSINDKSSIVISETLAARFFDSIEDAVGKTITQVVDEKEIELKVAGVFREQPFNSSFHKRNGSAYVNVENYLATLSYADDWKNEATVFAMINDPTRVTDVQDQLQAFVKNNNQVRNDFQVAEFKLDRFSTMAYTDRSEGVLARTWPAPPIAAILGAIVMSILILLIACFNLTNTSIALSAQRLKEIGIRKVMGSMRIQLIFQFIGETTCICFIALVVGIAVSDFLVSGWNVMTGNNIHLSPADITSPGVMLFLGGVLLFTGILAGSYPAFYITRFQPVSILKGKLKFGGTNYFTRTLLGLQFVVCMIAITSAIGFYQNAQYQKNFDLGFDVRGSIVATVNDEKEFETYRNALSDNPHIGAMAGCKTSLLSRYAHVPVKNGSIELGVDMIEVGENYLEAMQIDLVEGRNFHKDSESDKTESVLITEKMAALLALEKPLGKEISIHDSIRVFVVGVIRDVYTNGLWQELQPMMIRYVDAREYRQLVVNTAPENAAGVNHFMKEKWATVFPNRVYAGRMLDDHLQQINDLNTGIVYSYVFLGTFAMLLSVTGLFSLVSVNIVKRMKEIGVRKILGASVFNIARVINFEFVVVFTLAMMIGSWAALNWTSVIMDSIWKYYQSANVVTFLSAISILFAASFLTIGYKIFSVATMNPVNTLKED